MLDSPETVNVRTLFHGRKSPHTLWAHPPTEKSEAFYKFQLDGHYKTLHGVVAMSDGEKHDAASWLQFRIWADSKLIWKSPPMKRHDTSEPFRVNVKNVKKLELFVECPASNEHAWCIWVDPILER